MTLDKDFLTPPKKSKQIKSPVSDTYMKLFEENLPQLKEKLDEYAKAWHNAHNYYVI